MPTPAVPELLCPAGDEDALRAAVDCGADAVYLGLGAFSARASAANFEPEALERAVRYAHLYHARVHVTLNTLVRQDELPAVCKALEDVRRAGVDAVIVQDLGVAALARRLCPGLALHASTQMALCSAEGARMARRLGFTRVVLARECPLEEIRAVARTGVETEVFVHGALCSAVSGRCLMSAMAGGRSGNRGRCAQPCRQRFELDGYAGALLSLKDLCLLDDLPALCRAGVSSLKIEGRMKSAEYVAVVASVYRRALDRVARGEAGPGDPGAREALLQIFNRGGFTRGHAMGDEDAALCCTGRVGHEGVALGALEPAREGFAALRASRDLNDGDTLQIRGREDEELRYSGPDVPAGATALVRLRPGMRAAPGSPVSRLHDARLLEAARAHAPKPIPVWMRARLVANEPATLWMSDGQTAVTVRGPVPQAAKSRATAPEEARRQLARLGGTPFQPAGADALSIELADGLFLAVSELNALRRQAVEALKEARVRAFAAGAAAPPEGAEKELPEGAPNPCTGGAPDADAWPRGAANAGRGPAASPLFADTLAVIFSEPSLAPSLAQAGATMLIFSPRDFTPEALGEALSALPQGVWLRLPARAGTRALSAALPVLRGRGSGLGGLMAENLGQLDLPLDLPVLAGEGVPVTNREGMAALAGTRAQGFVLWPEWTGAQQRALLPFTLPCLLRVYGRETLMLINHCPERVRRGLSKGRASCGLCRGPRMACGREDAVLRDRKGYRFPLWRTALPEGCELTVLNALPTDLRPFDGDRRALGAGMLLHFTTEPPSDQVALTEAFRALLQGKVPPPPKSPDSFAGLWTRGVE